MSASKRPKPSPDHVPTNSTADLEAFRTWAENAHVRLKKLFVSSDLLDWQIDEEADEIWHRLERKALLWLPESEAHAFRYTEFPGKSVRAYVLGLLERAAGLGEPPAHTPKVEPIETEGATPVAISLPPVPSSKQEAQNGDQVSLRLLKVYTNGLADERIEKAKHVLSDDKLSANEKLTKIDALIRFPANASAEQLGDMLGVSKQAVLKTAWWTENRKGEKEDEIGCRRAVHQKRAERYEPPHANDDADER